MLKVYGTPICKDCLAMKIIFEMKEVNYEYVDLTKNTTNLKEFLQLRDTDSMYEEIRKNGGIGIPFFTMEEKKTFDINQALEWVGKETVSEEELARITEECTLLLK